MHEVLFAGRSLSAVVVVMMVVTGGSWNPGRSRFAYYIFASDLAALSGDCRLV